MSSGQHVGRQSDSLVDDDVRSAARAQQQALKALAQPNNRSRGPRQDLGNGDPCPTHPEHGKTYVLSSGREWCAHQMHDMAKLARRATVKSTAGEAATDPLTLPDIDMEGF